MALGYVWDVQRGITLPSGEVVWTPYIAYRTYHDAREAVASFSKQ